MVGLFLFYEKQNDTIPNEPTVSGGAGTYMHKSKGEILSIDGNLIQVELDLADNDTKNNFQNDTVVFLDSQYCFASTLKRLTVGAYIEFQFLDFSTNDAPILVDSIKIL